MSDPMYPDVGRPRGHPASRQPAGELGPPRDFIARGACPGEGCRLWAGHLGKCVQRDRDRTEIWVDGRVWADGDYGIDADGRHWQLRHNANKRKWSWCLLSAGNNRPPGRHRPPMRPAKLIPDTGTEIT